jgi:hypothetical protein
MTQNTADLLVFLILASSIEFEHKKDTPITKYALGVYFPISSSLLIFHL